jgi:hypothetical protein
LNFEEMRLLDTITLQFKEVIGCGEDYAILSHTWGDEEVSFKEFKKPNRETKKKSGYRKIESAAMQAKGDGFRYIWIDTCCIDQRSSAELSEAINSMYNWYSASTVCYVYLVDVDNNSRMENSRWFRRGWTLQELIAPWSVIFFTRDWSRIGTKKEMARRLSIRTRVPVTVLGEQEPVFLSSVAERMTWIGDRETTREEDIAYCLFGIFHVNSKFYRRPCPKAAIDADRSLVPLLYGEGMRAFRRLQEHIIQTHHDYSIFTFSIPEKSILYYGQVLTSHPAHFNNSEILRVRNPDLDPFSISNVGLSITLQCRDLPQSENPGDIKHWGLNMWSGCTFCEVVLGSKGYGNRMEDIILTLVRGIGDEEEEYKNMPWHRADRNLLCRPTSLQRYWQKRTLILKV